MHANSEPTCRTVQDLLRLPWSKLFWIERVGGVYRTGDAESHFHDKQNVELLTFDIANNTMLANVGVQGVLSKLSSYHPTYRGSSRLPGVWLTKDRLTYGPYAYTLEIAGESYDLATVAWDLRTGLLDNIFPITELYDPLRRFTARLLTVAPLSADGAQRLPGVIYGLSLENHTSEDPAGRRPLARAVHGAMGPLISRSGWRMRNPSGKPSPSRWRPAKACGCRPFSTRRGNRSWRRSTRAARQAWLLDSWAYYRRLLGRLEIADDGYLADFYEREALQALQSLSMSDSETVSGANWGSYPPTQEIWIKDMYYAALPLMGLDPLLAHKLIRWFAKYEIRHAGSQYAGGISHATSLSVASLLLAAHYYDQSGDTAFFHENPELPPSGKRGLPNCCIPAWKRMSGFSPRVSSPTAHSIATTIPAPTSASGAR